MLSLELLLKLLLEQHAGQPTPRHHRYAELFDQLPQPLREELLQLAGQRIGPSALNKNAAAVLEELGTNFVALRYPHDKYSDLTEEEYARRGSSWVAAGAGDDAATFRYHPEELLGLTHALKQMVGC